MQVIIGFVEVAILWPCFSQVQGPPPTTYAFPLSSHCHACVSPFQCAVRGVGETSCSIAGCVFQQNIQVVNKRVDRKTLQSTQHV